jgi:hypothetical protein
MPEEQGVWGDAWTDRLNMFLKTVLRWRQHGTSNNDIRCDELGRKVGIDSVLSYKRNSTSYQQIVIAEAKSLQKMGSFTRGRVQNWVEDFIPKLECVPHSEDFTRLFVPETNAQYQLGILAVWIREQDTYSHDDFQRVLSQIQIVRRRNPLNICFISNWHIIRMCAIHDTLEQLISRKEYQDIQYYFPTYGLLPDADGMYIPIETLVSKFVFVKAKKIQKLKVSKEEKNNAITYDSYIVFYLGAITNYSDLRFIGLALKNFQMFKVPELDIYTYKDITEIRNFIENFRQEFTDSGTEFIFHQLDLPSNLPGWLSHND